ncbi:hypothetical protein O181_036912 [Austropuccinia psidii MF-1]|uniref:Uncharacterized protein n=1 Tax=Austropuccinia psidii MF-1 TaxID=1389203 RepID=A0A9Q3D7Z6_9BASI|nr:hypothetical protein [Austropuccinia psidii MF-1]
MIRALPGPNVVQLESTGELRKTHLILPVSLRRPLSSSDKELFPLSNIPPLQITPLEEGEDNKIVKLLKEQKTQNKKEREYPVRYQKQLKKLNGYLRRI